MKKGKINYTGYWIFMNNPNNWELDRFLEDNIGNIGLKLAWTLPEWQKDKFNVGEYGIFRIGKDRRNKEQLAGRKKLESGVYAIGKVITLPRLKDKEEIWDNEYNINKESSYLKSYYCIDIEIIANLVKKPLIFNEIRNIQEIEEDSYLIPGFQSATIPLSKVAFDKILELAKINKNKDVIEISDSLKDIESLDLIGDERETLIKSRIGHSKFKELLKLENHYCPICGLNNSSLLSKVAFDKILELAKINKNKDVIEISDSLKDIESLDLIGDERETLIKSRIGHSKFKELLKLENHYCPICGLNNSSLLIASHIKPWSKSDSKEKVDIDNGILFCPNHDYLFDKGLISFDNEGQVLISSLLSQEDKIILGIKESIKINLSEKKKKYLEWHRKNIYKK